MKTKRIIEEAEAIAANKQAEMGDPEPLYDDSPLPGPSGLYGWELNDGLNDEQIEDALNLAPITRGVMVVTGPPGSGKGLWGNVMSKKIKTYYKGRHVFRDEIPRRLFGPYHLLSAATVTEDFKSLSQIAVTANEPKGKLTKAELKKYNEEKAEGYVRARLESKLCNSCTYLSEAWRWFFKRRAGSNLNYIGMSILKMWRHLDMLMIMDSQFMHDLDVYSCLPYVTHEVRCVWADDGTETGIGVYRVYPIKLVGDNGVMNVTGDYVEFEIKGDRPVKWLGKIKAPDNDGKIIERWGTYYDLFNSKSNPNLATPQRIKL